MPASTVVWIVNPGSRPSLKHFVQSGGRRS
jgi:hypothetical protein